MNLIDHCLKCNPNFEQEFKAMYQESAKSLDTKILIQAFSANTKEAFVIQQKESIDG